MRKERFLLKKEKAYEKKSERMVHRSANEMGESSGRRLVHTTPGFFEKDPDRMKKGGRRGKESGGNRAKFTVKRADVGVGAPTGNPPHSSIITDMQKGVV